MSEIYKNIPQEDLIDLLKDFKSRSTQVVGWYPNGHTVRGPFNRWFYVTEVANEYETHVGSMHEDVQYAAAAMNAVPRLIEIIEKLQEKADRLELALELEKAIDSETK